MCAECQVLLYPMFSHVQLQQCLLYLCIGMLRSIALNGRVQPAHIISPILVGIAGGGGFVVAPGFGCLCY